jgi:hypothetical protein
MGLKFRRGTTAQKSGSLAFGEPYVNTDLGTLQIGGNTGDITLGASGTGSQGSFAGISGSSLDITGNAKIDGNLTLGGNITIGDNTSDTVAMTANLSSSLIPSLTNTFDLGSAAKQWRHLYISTGSVYMNGVAILSSNATDLTLTTDAGQSLKLLESAADTITLQTAEGNLTLTSTGAGDVILDPNTGVVSIKGTLQIQDGNKVTSSGGNTIQFGNNVAITGSLTTTTGLTVGGNLIVNGTTTTIDSTNINIGDNIIVLNGTVTTNGGIYVKDGAGASTLTGSLLWDTTNDKWIAGTLGNEIGILRVGGDSVVSSSTQIPALLPTGVVSGSSQTIANLPTGVVSGSSQTIANLPTGTVSGSSQVVGILSSLNTYTGSNDTTNTAQSARLTTIESVTGSYETKGRGIVSGSAQIDGSLLGSNKTITVGSTAITLGGTATTIAGLTSVTSTAFVGALTGNASTVTTNANLTGNVTSVGNATTIASGVVTSDMIVDGTIVNGDINASAAIVDTKLATIATAGKVSNSATTATSANTVSAIVARDGSGNFSAGTITAALTGNASTATTAAALTTARTINGTSFDGSANITIANLVSGSAQVTLSSTTGGTTSSNVQFNSLGIGMAASATAGRIDATNDVVAFSSSDIRFKENIVPIENALDKISKISGNTYDWKAENKIEHGYEGNDVGVIAQEIEAVLPQLVQTRENGFKAVKYDKLVALLIEGIKEQQQQIEKLRMDLDNYECKCDNCKSK